MNIFDFKNIFHKKRTEPDYDFLRALPEKKYENYLKEIYKIRTGLTLNLKNPKRFNEKIQYLKLNDNMAAKSKYTDKIAVRDYCAEKIGDNSRLKEILGTYNSFDEIDFDILPDKFLIQTNHGSKMLLKIKNKELFLKQGAAYARNQFNAWLDYNFAFCAGFELQYRDIKPKILIEKLYENDDKSPVKDYMIFCSEGTPKFINSIVYSPNGGKHGFAYYDSDWSVYNNVCMQGFEFMPALKPVFLEKMLAEAALLSKDFKFVRVDFMHVNDDFYFSELTFTPNSGFVRFIPDKYDFYFGSFIKL